MIVVNIFFEEDYNPETDGYHLTLAGVINNELDLNYDPELIIEAIDNDEIFKPKAGNMYEVQLIRATIASAYPFVKRAFVIDRIIEKVYDNESSCFITPLVKL